MTVCIGLAQPMWFSSDAMVACKMKWKWVWGCGHHTTTTRRMIYILMDKLLHQLAWLKTSRHDFQWLNHSQLVIPMMSINMMVPMCSQRVQILVQDSPQLGALQSNSSKCQLLWCQHSQRTVQSNNKVLDGVSGLFGKRFVGTAVWIYETMRHEWTIWWYAEFCQAPEPDAAMEARDQLKRLIAITYSKDWFALGVKVGSGGLNKNSQRVHEVNCTKCFRKLLEHKSLLGQSEGILRYRNPIQALVDVLKGVFPYEFHCATAAMALTEHGSIYFVCRFPLWRKEVTDVP